MPADAPLPAVDRLEKLLDQLLPLAAEVSGLRTWGVSWSLGAAQTGWDEAAATLRVSDTDATALLGLVSGESLDGERSDEALRALTRLLTAAMASLGASNREEREAASVADSALDAIVRPALPALLLELHEAALLRALRLNRWTAQLPDQLARGPLAPVTAALSTLTAGAAPVLGGPAVLATALVVAPAISDALQRLALDALDGRGFRELGSEVRARACATVRDATLVELEPLHAVAERRDADAVTQARAVGRRAASAFVASIHHAVTSQNLHSPG